MRVTTDRVSSSLLAGVCTMCVTASVMAGVPGGVKVPAAPSLPTVPSVDARYALTASSAVLDDFAKVALLPLQNVGTVTGTVLEQVGALNLLTPVANDVLAGTWSKVQPDLQAAFGKEQGYLQDLVNVPQKISATNAAAISKLLGDFGIQSLALAATPTVRTADMAATSPTAVPVLAVLDDFAKVVLLPLQNVSTVAGAVLQLVSILNVLTPAANDVLAGSWSKIQPDIEAGFVKAQGYVQALADVPGSIVATDTAVISRLLGDFGIPAPAMGPSVRTAANLAVAPSTTGSSAVLDDLAKVALLPLQNVGTVTGAVLEQVGALNLLTPAANDVLTGSWSKVQPDLQAALVKEQGYLKDLADVPQKISATNAAAVAKLAGDLGFGSVSPTGSLLKSSVTAAPDDQLGASKKGALGKLSASTGRTATLPKFTPVKQDGAGPTGKSRVAPEKANDDSGQDNAKDKAGKAHSSTRSAGKHGGGKHRKH